jgi:hypothetical protein
MRDPRTVPSKRAKVPAASTTHSLYSDLDILQSKQISLKKKGEAETDGRLRQTIKSAHLRHIP